ncbi:MAG: winged helix-turn-helix domain-containing protein [Solirubrobacteraceae bacterium]
MADLLDVARRQIHERLNELRPLVHEYHRLEAAASALGGARPSSKRARKTSRRASKGAASATAASTSTPRRRSARAPRGARAAQALSQLREQPGIPAAEVAKHIGASRTYVHALLVRLEREGRVVRRGSAWHAKDEL